MKNFLPFQYQFQSQKSFVSAEQTKVKAKAPISDSNSRFLMVQWGGRGDVAELWPRLLCRDSQAREF